MKLQEKQRAKPKRRGQKKVAKRAAKEAQSAPTTAPSGPEQQPEQLNKLSSVQQLCSKNRPTNLDAMIAQFDIFKTDESLLWCRQAAGLG